MRTNGARGTAMIEFCVLTPFWLVLLLGTLRIGTRMVTQLQLVQVARDTASMYARGVEFDDPTNQEFVARLGQELGLKATGGNGVVILSKFRFIGPAQCASCTNRGRWVFTQRIKFGQTGLRNSNWGTPTCPVDDKGNLSGDDSLKNTCAQVQNFNLLGTPSDTVDGFKPGEDAYLVEVFVNTTWGNGAYAYAIF